MSYQAASHKSAMRPAARAWDEDFSRRLMEAGYIKGKAASTAFVNPVTGGQCVVHVDDFTFVADMTEIERMKRLMGEWYESKVKQGTTRR